MPQRVFTVSDELFSGFTALINVSEESLLDNIALEIRNKLVRFLNTAELTALVVKANQKRWHIHNLTIQDILKPQTSAYYVCTQCNGA